MSETQPVDYLTDWDWQMVDIVRERVRQTFPTSEEGRLLRFADALLAARAELAQHAALVACAREYAKAWHTVDERRPDVDWAPLHRAEDVLHTVALAAAQRGQTVATGGEVNDGR